MKRQNEFNKQSEAELCSNDILSSEQPNDVNAQLPASVLASTATLKATAKSETLINTIQESETLINTIQERELSINNIKTEMIKQWISQGEDLLELQEQLQCSQNKLTQLTGISKGTIYNYIQLSNDKRILEWIQGAHYGGQLESFTQKELLNLTKLDDSTFEASVNAGVIVSISKDQVIDAEIIESSINDKIYKKEESIKKLKMDLMSLKEELASEKKRGPRPVAQIDDKGNIIAQYPSAQGAQRITGIDKSSIGSACRGSARTAGGYRWKFLALF